MHDRDEECDDDEKAIEHDRDEECDDDEKAIEHDRDEERDDDEKAIDARPRRGGDGSRSRNP